MPPKQKPVDALPRTPRKNARGVVADPVDPDVEMTDDAEPTFDLNAALARVRFGPVLHPSRYTNGV